MAGMAVMFAAAEYVSALARYPPVGNSAEVPWVVTLGAALE